MFPNLAARETCVAEKNFAARNVEWVSSISSLNPKQSYLTFIGYAKLILLRFTELSLGKRKTLALLKIPR